MATATVPAVELTPEQKAKKWDELMTKKNGRKAKSRAIKEAKNAVLAKHSKDLEAELAKRGLTLVK